MDMPSDILPLLRMSDSALHDFVVSQTDGVHIKDTSGAYIFSNHSNLKIFGLRKTEDLMGLTVFDLDKFMRPYWKKNYAEKIAEMDFQVKDQCKSIKKTQDILLDARNQVYIQDLLKLPLVGRNNKVTAVLTMLTNRTKETNLFFLFNLYKNMYSNKSTGLIQFIEFLGIADFFYENPTEKEMSCLLHMRTDASYKRMANKLNISIKTVETHVSHVIGKLKSGELHSLLSHLRN